VAFPNSVCACRSLFVETMSAATAAYEKQILDYRIWRSRCVDPRASEEINSAQVVTIRLDQERTKGRALGRGL
jgi:hypothetical protein